MHTAPTPAVGRRAASYPPAGKAKLASELLLEVAYKQRAIDITFVADEAENVLLKSESLYAELDLLAAPPVYPSAAADATFHLVEKERMGVLFMFQGGPLYWESKNLSYLG